MISLNVNSMIEGVIEGSSGDSPGPLLSTGIFLVFNAVWYNLNLFGVVRFGVESS